MAEPLDEEFCKAIEDKEINPRDDQKELQKVLNTKFGWDLQECKKLWCFGPEESGPNVLVDATKGIQYMNEIKDHVKTAF